MGSRLRLALESACIVLAALSAGAAMVSSIPVPIPENYIKHDATLQGANGQLGVSTSAFPSLSSPNIWAAVQTFAVAPVFSDQAGTRTALGVTATGADTGYLWRANNLGDLASPSSARANLGLGTAATQNTGTSGANVPLLNGANTWFASQSFSQAIQLKRANLTTLASGLNSNIAATAGYNRISGPTSAFSIGGFTAGGDGNLMIVFNTTSQAMTIVDNDASSSVGNRIRTLTGANVTLRTGTSMATFIYDGNAGAWFLVATN